MIEVTGVTLKLNHTVRRISYSRSMKRSSLAGSYRDSTYRRNRSSEGVELSQRTADKAPVGKKVAIIGCGGIGFERRCF